MEYVIEYISKEERSEIINKNSSRFLIGEKNISEGNFLVFSDSPIETHVIYTNVPEEELNKIKTAQAETNTSLLEFMELIISQEAI